MVLLCHRDERALAYEFGADPVELVVCAPRGARQAEASGVPVGAEDVSGDHLDRHVIDRHSGGPLDGPDILRPQAAEQELADLPRQIGDPPICVNDVDVGLRSASKRAARGDSGDPPDEPQRVKASSVL